MEETIGFGGNSDHVTLVLRYDSSYCWRGHCHTPHGI